MDRLIFTPNERSEALAVARRLKTSISRLIKEKDEEKVFAHIKKSLRNGAVGRDVFGLNPILMALQTAQIAVDEIGLKRDGVLAILLYAVAETDDAGLENIRQEFGDSVARIIRELPQPAALFRRGYARNPHHDSRPRQPDAPNKGRRERGGKD